MTLTVILKYHGIRCPHPGHVSDSLALSVEGPQDYCFSGAPHLHSWDEATQAPGTRQAGHEVSRSTPSTTTNINKTIYIYVCVSATVSCHLQTIKVFNKHVDLTSPLNSSSNLLKFMTLKTLLYALVNHLLRCQITHLFS